MFVIAPWKAQALAAGVAETVIQLQTRMGQAIEIVEIVCNFNGTEGSAVPVLLELCRQRDDGTFSATLVPEALNPLDLRKGAIQTVAVGTQTAAPTALHTLHTWQRHPQGGLNYRLPDNRDARAGAPMKLIVPGDNRLGLVVTAPAIVSCSGYIKWRE